MASDISKQQLATKLCHLGRNSAAVHGLVNPPLYRGSTILFNDLDELYGRKATLRYCTYNTPGTLLLQELMLELDQIPDGAATFHPSGLAAITTLLDGLLVPGDHVLMTDGVYPPTRRYAEKVLQQRQITFTYYPPRIKGSELSKLVKSNTRMLFMESASSNSFELQDIPALTAVARQHKLNTVLDNTWSGGVHFQPFAHGVDYVIYAMTKYHLAHSNGLLGAVLADKANKDKLLQIQRFSGSCPGASEIDAALLAIRSLPLRLQQHQHSTTKICEWLLQQSDVTKVRYPVLASDPDHALWQRDYTGAPGLCSFALQLPQAWQGDTTACNRALQRLFSSLQLLKMGFSWGGYISLLLPVDLSDKRLRLAPDHSVVPMRLQVGLEAAADICADLAVGIAAFYQGSVK